MMKKQTFPKNHTRPLNEYESKNLLKSFEIPVVYEIKASNMKEAVEAADQIGFPVVVKALGADLLHKSDQNLVFLNCRDVESVKQSVTQILNHKHTGIEGFLVQPQISGRRELLAGLYYDRMFGPVIMLGMGGIFTEVLSETHLRMAPLTEADAHGLIEDVNNKGLLNALRGEAPVDRQALFTVLMGLSRLSQERSDITEIDINPLKITAEGGVLAVDALVIKSHHLPRTDEKKHADLAQLTKLFHPGSVAFIGATDRMAKWGHYLPTIAISRGYEGDIYLVNSRGGHFLGRKVYPSLTDIPGPVDLAVVTIPAPGVIDLIAELEKKQVPGMLLISSGFSETGDQGRLLENQLISAAKAAGILILGPNTMGICNPHISFYCTGSHVWPGAGPTAFVSQSGNLGTQLLAFAEQQGIGIRGFAGTGNEAMITVEDLLEAFETDPKTRVIMLYVESVKDGHRFFRTARRVSRKKPIILLKGGRTGRGNKAASSHTGAMASDEKVFNAVCRQAGIVQVDHSIDLLDLCAAFSTLPLPRKNRVAILTLGGGWGVVTTDLCEEYGLDVVDLPDELIAYIDQYLPDYWSRANPVDIVGEGDPEIPAAILDVLCKWDGCDAVIHLGIVGKRLLVNRYFESIRKSDETSDKQVLESLKMQFKDIEQAYLKHVARLMKQYEKPIIGVSLLTEHEDRLFYGTDEGKTGPLVFPTPERAVKALSKMVDYRQFLKAGISPTNFAESER